MIKPLLLDFIKFQLIKRFDVNFCPALSERALDHHFEMCVCVTYFQASDWSKVSDILRRQTFYDIARLLLMVPIKPWQNSTPFFGAAAFCTSKIEDFRRQPQKCE